MAAIIDEIGVLKILVDTIFTGLDKLKVLRKTKHIKMAGDFSKLSITLANIADAIEQNDDGKMSGACGELATFANKMRYDKDMTHLIAVVAKSDPKLILDEVEKLCRVEHSIRNDDLINLDSDERKKLIRDYRYVSGEFKALADIFT